MAENNGLLNRMHRDYRSDHKRLTGAKRKKLSAIEKLKKLKQNEGSEAAFELFVDYSDSETGDLYHYDDFNICYVVRAEELKRLYPGYVPRGNSYLLGTTFRVRISSVDMDKSVVELYPEKNLDINLDQYRKRAANMDMKGSESARLSRALLSYLDDNDNVKKPVVRGTITKVEKDRIFVDLFDKGLTAVIPVKNYMEQYRRDLRDEVMVGDSLKGVVFAYRSRENEDEKHFLMSTVGFLPDPWWSEKVRSFKPNDIILVKCVEKPEREKAMFYWGIAPVLPGIDILCDYTQKVPRTAVAVGKYYKCKIGSIDREKRKLTVAPFEECKGPGGKSL